MPDEGAMELLAEGDRLLTEGLLTEAFEAYDRALDADDTSAPALLRAGMALLQSGAFHEAYLYLEQAARELSEDPEVWRLLGAAALGGGQGELAREALERCRETGGEITAESELDLALAAYWDLDVVAALEYAHAALTLEPGNEEASRWIAKLEGFEDDHGFLVDVARGHCRQGRFGLGAELFKAAFRYGDSFEARLHGGRAMLAAGRVASAVELLEAAADMRPDDKEVARDLALARSIAESDDLGEATPAPAPTPRQAFCTRCGRRLRPTSRFCPSCGEAVDGR